MMLSIEKTASSKRILADRCRESHARLTAEHVRRRFWIDVVMNLLRCLPNEEPASGDQNHIAPGEAVAEDRDDRFSELHDEEDHAQKANLRTSAPLMPSLRAFER